MKTISKPGDNLGGLLKMWAIPRSVVSVSGRTVYIVSSADVYEIYCTPDSMSMQETPELSNAGTHYNVKIAGFIPRDSDTVRTAMEEMQQRPYAVLFQDGNGEYKLAGGTHEPLRFSAALSTGRETGEAAGHLILFSGPVSNRAVFVDNPFA